MKAERKAALKRAYKEQSFRRGIYQVKCETTGQIWVDATPNLDTIKNRIWFDLRMGSHPNKTLQATWNNAGDEAMTYTILEVFDEDTPDYALERLSKNRKAHWMAHLQATSCQ